MSKSQSYKIGFEETDCQWLNSKMCEPCWGQVDFLTEDYDDEDNCIYIYACAGHSNIFESYIKEENV